MSLSSHPPALTELPPPDADALVHSDRLRERIAAEIDAAGGVIPFECYMELALYAPGLGYYAAGARKFGAGGDFVTAPELSPLFGRCLAHQCREVLEELGGGEILEFGAGSGAMAADLLAELAELDALPERYLILERSPELRERQRVTLAERVPRLAGRVVWLDGLPQTLRGVVVANELLDAMAVRRFRITAAGPRELGVASDGGGFVTRLLGRDAALEEAVAAIEAELEAPLAEGYESEFNPALGPWLAGVAAMLGAGLVLLIDYGYPRRDYYHPQRSRGTLLCHYRHRVHEDPFLHPGLQDITASVEFTAVAEAGTTAGLELAGYATQAQFLIGCGLLELAAEREGEERLAALERMRQVKLLTLPGEMGERFQAMAFARGLERPLRGFAFGDRRGWL